MSSIFISYRRDDTAGEAGRLQDRLVSKFGRPRVFMDVYAMEPGLDFVEVIEEHIGKCSVLLVVIGKRWLGSDQAARRLDDEGDFHRLEIEAALSRGIRVIPVLVQGATMPGERDLPASLKSFARRHALEISATRWDYDVGQLFEVVDRILKRVERDVAPPSVLAADDDSSVVEAALHAIDTLGVTGLRQQAKQKPPKTPAVTKKLASPAPPPPVVAAPPVVPQSPSTAAPPAAAPRPPRPAAPPAADISPPHPARPPAAEVPPPRPAPPPAAEVPPSRTAAPPRVAVPPSPVPTPPAAAPPPVASAPPPAPTPPPVKAETRHIPRSKAASPAPSTAKTSEADRRPVAPAVVQKTQTSEAEKPRPVTGSTGADDATTADRSKVPIALGAVAVLVALVAGLTFLGGDEASPPVASTQMARAEPVAVEPVAEVSAPAPERSSEPEPEARAVVPESTSPAVVDPPPAEPNTSPTPPVVVPETADAMDNSPAAPSAPEDAPPSEPVATAPPAVSPEPIDTSAIPDPPPSPPPPRRVVEAGLQGVFRSSIGAAGLTVRLVGEETLETTTGEDGSFSFLPVVPGAYHLIFLRDDESVYERDDLTLDSGQFMRMVVNETADSPR